MNISGYCMYEKQFHMPKCLSGVQKKAKTVHKYLIIDNSIPNLKKNAIWYCKLCCVRSDVFNEWSWYMASRYLSYTVYLSFPFGIQSLVL